MHDHDLAAALLAFVDGYRHHDADAIARRIADDRAPLDAPDDARGALILAGAAAQCADLARAFARLAALRCKRAIDDHDDDDDAVAVSTFRDLKRVTSGASQDAERARAAIRDLVSE